MSTYPMPSVSSAWARLKEQIMTNRELNSAVTKALTKNNIPRSAYSISTKDGHIHITIIHPKITTSQVDAVIKQFENFDRCPATGEILGGHGNRYAFCMYDGHMRTAIERDRHDQAYKLVHRKH